MRRLSIGLAVHNGERYLSQTLDALLCQTFGDFDVIICDNASSDKTCAIIEAYSSRDLRIVHRRNTKNIGALPNFNQTLRMARGEYFKFAGHDDLIEPTYLEKCVSMLDRDRSIVLAHSKVRIIDEDGDDLVFDSVTNRLVNKYGLPVIEPPDANYGEALDPIERFRNVLDKTITCHFALGVMRRAAVAKSGGFGLFHTSDRAFLAEMALYGRFGQVQETLFLKREHPRNSRTLAAPERQLWAAGRLTNEKSAEYLQLLKAIARSPLGPWDKACCLAVGFSKIANRLRCSALGKLPSSAPAIEGGN
jgi:glycosyltransferase involved in cell wall biosynthesis